MKKRAQFDLVVVGAEPAGFAAAAVAARQGAAVLLVKGGARPSRTRSTPGIPDFVWRKLNLQDSGLDARPVAARVSLFEDGKPLVSYASSRRTCDELERAHNPDARLIPDFEAALGRLWSEGASLAHASASGAGNGVGPLLSAISAPDGAAAARRLTTSGAALLEDFFSDERLRTHYASVALAPFGLGGDEPASGLALAALTEPAAWRLRASAKGPSIARVLEDAAIAAGVKFADSAIRQIQRRDSKSRVIIFDNEEVVRATHLMAATAEAAAGADLEVAPSFSPLARREGATADIRLKFQKAPPAPAAGKDAIYFIADSLASIADARDAAAEGRLAERMPISFEFNKDEIVVHAPYCPAFLKTEDEIRDWSEQDRQAFGLQIISRLEPYLNGAAQTVRRVEVRVSPTRAAAADDRSTAILAPPASHDPIGAAAKLALELVGG